MKKRLTVRIAHFSIAAIFFLAAYMMFSGAWGYGWPIFLNVLGVVCILAVEFFGRKG